MLLKKDRLDVAGKHAASARSTFAIAADALDKANEHLDTVQTEAEENIEWHESQIDALFTRYHTAGRAKADNAAFAQRIRALLEG